LLRSFDLRILDYPVSGAVDAQSNSGERSRVRRSLEEFRGLLPSWSNNLSNTYFSHARTLPITIGE
jgi:hypothetical protein